MAQKTKFGYPDKPSSRRSTSFVLLTALAILLAAAFLFFLRERPVIPSGEEDIPPTVATEDAFYMPGEFQSQDALLLGGAQLAELYPVVLAKVVEAASSAIRIQILAGSSAGKIRVEEVLSKSGLPLDNLDILTLPAKTMWVRDFGPITVSDRNGFRSMVDFHYRERRGNSIDDGVPALLATAMGLNIMGSPLMAEGGDFLSNGRGLCLLSTRVVNRNAHYLEMEPDQAMANFAAILGFENLLLLPPLQGEPTGHVDIFCTLLKPDLAVVGMYDPDDDPANADHLDGIVTRLKNFPTLDGPLKVERIPMPNHDDGVWRTYTNIVLANRVVLVPIYPDYCPELDEVALNTYRRLLPDRQIVGVDASGLIRMNGALRCITMNIPSAIPITLQ
jgi:agmatine/peptidylarginine deiminase